MGGNTIELRVKRQDGPEAPARWEEFRIPYRPRMNVISALMEVRRQPVTAQGVKVSPVAWEANCLEEVCGACSMIINGKVRQACSTLVDQIAQPIVLEPMTKFPLVRDLMVDRQRMFEALKRLRAWVPIDGTYNLGPGPRVAPEAQGVSYSLSRCMTCGCCLEVCPQYNDHSSFMGAATMAQVVLFNLHPTGAMNKDERLAVMMGEGGIGDCGNAQNCVEVCPKEIPLTTAIGELGRQTTVKAFRDIFGR
jgi:succinate dehydrogenase / fumarate reductase iron-sulfur subunit